MSKRKTPRTPFAVDNNNTLFVKTRFCGIHPLVILVDALRTVRFGRAKTAYMLVEDVIAWHEKELQESKGHSGNPKILASLRTVLEKFKDGKVVHEE